MSEIINNFFNPEGVTLWKLYTLEDYLFFGGLLVLGAVALWAAVRFLAKRRTPEGTGWPKSCGESAVWALRSIKM